MGHSITYINLQNNFVRISYWSYRNYPNHKDRIKYRNQHFYIQNNRKDTIRIYQYHQMGTYLKDKLEHNRNIHRSWFCKVLVDKWQYFCQHICFLQPNSKVIHIHNNYLQYSHKLSILHHNLSKLNNLDLLWLLSEFWYFT